MNVPREKLRFRRSQGQEAGGKGWIVVNVRGMDLEGVNELAIAVAEIEAVSTGTGEADVLEKAKSLLGG